MEYNGSMVNSYFDGEGELKVINKSLYKGSFQAGMKYGYGVETFLSNKALTYKGNYIDNKFEGEGQLEGPNYFYKGAFRANKAHGEGFERTNEFEYKGSFKKGKRDGKGVLKMANGEIYQGYFEEGRITTTSTKPHKEATQYIKSIPIQSFTKNHSELQSMSPSTQLPQSSSLKLQLSPPPRPNKTTASPRQNNYGESSRVRLSKYLSKDLAALDEVNEEGTI